MGECVEEVRQQLLAMVRLDRELSHLMSALEGVEGVVGNLQAAQTPLVGRPWCDLNPFPEYDFNDNYY